MTVPPSSSTSFLEHPLARARFLEHVRRSSGLDASSEAPERRAALLEIASATHALLVEGEDRSVTRSATAARVVRALPRLIGDAMHAFGWLWNGFYVLEDDGHLHVAFAHGPPVCATLERNGGPLSSGMCFDGILLNQTLAAFDAKGWPGYVSCDAASGLATVAGIVSPVRDPSGAPIAVWDLDATQPITPLDVRFVDVLFATLARTVPFSREHVSSR